MIVYLLVNTVTELSIVGSTVRPLHERVEAYFDEARKGRRGSVYDALRAWPAWAWEAVVLERVEPSLGVRGMVLAEARWMVELGTVDPAVGYNSTEPDERHAARLEKQLPRELVEGRARGPDAWPAPPRRIGPLPDGERWMERYLAKYGTPEQVEREAARRRKRKQKQRARARAKRAGKAWHSMTEAERLEFFKECGGRRLNAGSRGSRG